MAKIAQLVEGNYNILDNIPVINQDLSASGFTPVANTYYRHTGATTDTFTQGIIYLYDTAYHKLGESGGGTTLNKYVATIGNDDQMSQANIALLTKILLNAKGNVTVYGSGSIQGRSGAGWTINYADRNIAGFVDFIATCYMSYYKATFIWLFAIQNGSFRLDVGRCIKIENTGTVSITTPDLNMLTRATVVYYNDTEIT